MPVYPFPYPSDFQIEDWKTHEGSIPRTSRRTRYTSSPGHRHRGLSTPQPILALHGHDDDHAHSQANLYRDEQNYSPSRGRSHSRPRSVGRRSRSQSPRRNHRDHRSSSRRRSRSNSPPRTRVYDRHTPPRRSYTYTRDDLTSRISSPVRPKHKGERHGKLEDQFPSSNGESSRPAKRDSKRMRQYRSVGTPSG